MLLIFFLRGIMVFFGCPRGYSCFVGGYTVYGGSSVLLLVLVVSCSSRGTFWYGDNNLVGLMKLARVFWTFSVVDQFCYLSNMPRVLLDSCYCLGMFKMKGFWDTMGMGVKSKLCDFKFKIRHHCCKLVMKIGSFDRYDIGNC